VKIYDYNGKKNICGERVHEARCKHRLTQSDLAARLQIAGIIIERDSISRIEIGTRFVADYELREIAKILKVSVNTTKVHVANILQKMEVDDRLQVALKAIKDKIV